MDQIERDSLKQLASKYVWWKTPDEADCMPEQIIAQVMNIGDYEDVRKLSRQVGDDMLRKVLLRAQAGQFGKRSWTYWNYRLGLTSLDQVPAMPVRSFG